MSGFDASGYTPQSFDLLPADWYTGIWTEALEKPTSKNNGTTNTDTLCAAVFEVIDGKYKGRKLFHNFNFGNSNEDAKKIAFDQLGAICHAVGQMKIANVNDPRELFNKPMLIKVKIKPAVMEDDGVTEKWEARNEIKAFKSIEGGKPSAGAAPAGAAGGLPEGFTAGVSAAPAAPATPATPAAAAIPSTPAIPAATPAAPVKKLVMTEKAQGATAEQFRATDAAWTDDLLVSQGFAVWVEEQPAPAIPAAAPAVPVAPATPAAQAAGADAEETPPWLQQQA